MTRSEFEYEITPREHAGDWQVLEKLSTVRLGMTNREQVKSKEAIDSMQWFTVRTDKSEENCKKWVDDQWDNLVRMGIPYEVG